MNAKKIMFWIKWNLINRYREFYSRTKIFSRLDKSDALGLLLTINVFVTIFTIAILYLLYLAFIHFIGTNIKSVLATLLIIISLIPDVDRAKDSWQWGSLSAQNKEFLIYGTPLNEKQANFYSSIEGLSFQFTNYLVGYFIIYTFFLTIIGMPIYQSIMITIMLVLYKLSMTMFVSNVLSYVVTTVQRFSRILFTLVKHTLLIVFIYFIFFKIGSILGNKGNEIAINIKQNNGSNIWNQMVDSFHNFITMVLKDFFGPNTFIGNLVSNSIKFNGFGLIIFLLILMLISIFLALITLPIAKYDTFDLYNDNTLPKIKKYAINHLCLLVL